MKSLPFPELVSHTSSGIVYLTDDGLNAASGVRIAFTGRHGGASRSPFAGLNLGTHVGDDPGAVEQNRARLLCALGAPADCRLLALNQVHGTRVLEVGSESDIDAVRQEAAEGADGVAVAADAPDVAALLCFADCVPLVLAAPGGSFAVAHAGWRGVMGEIAGMSVRALAKLSGATPDSLNVYIGPHIRGCCFEVQAELAADFADKFGPAVLADAHRVDLSRALRVTLERCGVDLRRVCDAGLCTVCNVDDYYSYRAEGGQCGRHGALAFKGKEGPR